MREQRYSNVIEKYEAELKKQRTIAEAEAEEEKLSMTREIKYKDLQDEIDKNENLSHQDNYIDDLLENTFDEDEIKIIQRNKKNKNQDSAVLTDKVSDSNSKLNDHEKNVELNSQKESTSYSDELEEEPKKIKLKTVKSDDDFFEEMKTQRVNLPKNNDEEENESEDKEEKDNDKVNITKVNKDDDIYLTTAFEPLKSRLTIGKIFTRIIIFLVIIAALGALVYFVLFPLYDKYFLNNILKYYY